MSDLRVGLGYDMHAFAMGRRLVLGGVEVDHPLGLAGHSDADVLVHALMDALLGALRREDIGAHFPDTDQAYEGASSLDMLRTVAAMVAKDGWRLVDADCVLVLEAPRISPYRDAMRTRIADALGVAVDSIGLKATTTEGLGATGRREGVAATVVVLLDREG